MEQLYRSKDKLAEDLYATVRMRIQKGDTALVWMSNKIGTPWACMIDQLHRLHVEEINEILNPKPQDEVPALPYLREVTEFKAVNFILVKLLRAEGISADDHAVVTKATVYCNEDAERVRSQHISAMSIRAIA